MRQKSRYPVDVRFCPSCLKEECHSFCAGCRRKLFDGHPVSHVLPFSRPEYNERKRRTGGQRISISGLQSKHSLKREGNLLLMTEQGGQYILKPVGITNLLHRESTPANEHITMRLARDVFRIPTAECAIVFFNDGAPAYLTRRFDVHRDGARVPQEDFAQIAGKSEEKDGPDYKYDFSYESVGELMKKYVQAYKVEVDKFFKLVVFNYLVCNGDAHLKNFSLARSDEYGDYLLTPAYDLMNTKLHLESEPDTALSLFKGDYETEGYGFNGKYTRDDFIELGVRLGLDHKRIDRDLNMFAEGTLLSADKLLDKSFLPDDLKITYKKNMRERLLRLHYSYKHDQHRNP